ncbi:hypothetical protein [Lacticaseibacillus kribbianus]|uniref:hypothetical protein n=1 Tax=Lacticaseibacillus kribbianus TaxID=2926292 RepID=UPI001CD1F328|nr:hypothetical protein [Lacticaseibacillus kribbianus]
MAARHEYRERKAKNPATKAVAVAGAVFVAFIGPLVDGATALVKALEPGTGGLHLGFGGLFAHPAASGLLLGAVIALILVLAVRGHRPRRTIRTSYRAKGQGYATEHTPVRADRTPQRGRTGLVAVVVALVVAAGLLGLVLAA